MDEVRIEHKQAVAKQRGEKSAAHHGGSAAE